MFLSRLGRRIVRGDRRWRTGSDQLIHALSEFVADAPESFVRVMGKAARQTKLEGSRAFGGSTPTAKDSNQGV
jgi:hypothetical protein